MITIEPDTVPTFLWDSIKKHGHGGAYIHLPSGILHTKDGERIPECWSAFEIEPDFPRPGYTEYQRSQLGRDREEKYLYDRFLEGYWMAQFHDEHVEVFDTLERLETWINHYSPFPIMVISGPDGRKYKTVVKVVEKDP